jgi:dTDP-glucose 4,6-dehydratase
MLEIRREQMNLMITGGAGFIGSRFAELLVSQEIPNQYSSITVVDNLTYSGNLSNLDAVISKPEFYFHKADICNKEDIEAIIEHRSINVIANFAAESHVDRSIESAFEFLNTNVMGTQNLLDLAKKHGITRFLQVSTDEVYGSIPTGSWEEDEPLKPNSPYSASKAGADLLVLAYGKTYGMNVGITRCCNNYGLRQYPEKIIPLFVSNLIDGKRVPIYGDGNQIREWIHVDDHCRGVFAVLENGNPGEVYNIAGTDEFQNIELARKIIAYFGESEDNAFEFVADRKGHDIRYSLTGNKIHKELGIKPKIEFETGLKETIDWYVANESWWRPLKNKS